MPNVMAAQPNIGGARVRKFRNSIPSTTPQSLPHDWRVWGTPAYIFQRVSRLGFVTAVPYSNAVKIRELNTWTQSKCSWQNSVRGQEPPKMYITV